MNAQALWDELYYWEDQQVTSVEIYGESLAINGSGVTNYVEKFMGHHPIPKVGDLVRIYRDTARGTGAPTVGPIVHLVINNQAVF